MSSIRFLSNEAGKTEGLAYAGFETFRGSPYASCARETGQNSRDAWAGGAAVEVSFHLHQLERSDVPFADELQHAIQCCLVAPQDERTKSHLERALKTIECPVIKVLEISDVNTTGLTGPIHNEASVFNALVKGDGVTNKRDETSAGSFGIGKNAAYAISDLQTVIYSTLYRDAITGDARYATQGRLRLISHRDGDQRFSAEGYWGESEFQAIESIDKVPDWLRRTEIGTSIFAIGFREEANWSWRMTLSLVSNFFLAIDRNEICFTLDGNRRINKNSLDSILASKELEEIARGCDRYIEVDRAKRLVRCIRSEATTHHVISVPGLGDFDLHLLVAQDLPREVHIIRNGIYIADNFVNFSQPMRQFPGTREFTAVLEPASSERGRAPSALLKRIENPAHDSFEPERIVDEKTREEVRRQIKTLVQKVRAVIREQAKIEDVQRSQLDELSRFFGDAGAGVGNSGGDEESDPDRFRYGSASARRRAQTGVGEQGQGRGRGKEQGRKLGQRTGKSRKSGRRLGESSSVPLTDVRAVIPDPSNTHRRVVFFTADADAEMELAVSASGLTDDVELKVMTASSGLASNGRVRVSARAGIRNRLEIELEDSFSGPIELTATKVITANGAPA